MTRQLKLTSGGSIRTNGKTDPMSSLIQTATGLQDASVQAALATFVCDPNPRVGCVIVHASGHTLGQGHTQRVGQAHAEVMALRAARDAGHDVRGATAYVTLEPCAHFGRTAPCCDALIESGIARVVVAQQDPNPLVAGRGIERLRAAGIKVTVLDPTEPMAVLTRELNIGFFSRMVRSRPWLRMKIAASLDGKTALLNGAVNGSPRRPPALTAMPGAPAPARS